MELPPIVVANLKGRAGEPSPALIRAAEAWPEPDRGHQLAAVLKTAEQSPPRFVLLASAGQLPSSGLPLSAVLAECLPGRAAVVMTPQMDGQLSAEERHAVACKLLLSLDKTLHAQQILLAQALTISQTDIVTTWFLAAGYQFVGDLLYLLSPTLPLALSPSLPLEFLPHPPADFDRWIPLVDQTYQETLDCPAIDGLRSTRDVLIGYRDIGRERNDWWFIVRHENQDVGCLLLADHHPAAHAELVYMGLIPAARGRGWGSHLARQSLQIAADAGAEHVLLSVDAANLPALRHYQAAGFREWEQRSILIKSLG